MLLLFLACDHVLYAVKKCQLGMNFYVAELLEKKKRKKKDFENEAKVMLSNVSQFRHVIVIYFCHPNFKALKNY